MAQADEVALLILGAGWTSKILIPLTEREGIRHTATTRNGRAGTIAFDFDREVEEEEEEEEEKEEKEETVMLKLEPYMRLPRVSTVLVAFPLKGSGSARRLTEMYHRAHQVRHHQQKQQQQQQQQ